MSKKPVKSSLFRFVTLRVSESETSKKECPVCGEGDDLPTSNADETTVNIKL